MGKYDTPELNLEPDELAASIDEEDDDPYANPDDDDDENGIEGGLDEFENRPVVGTSEWKKLISEINKPAALSLKGDYLREKTDKKHRMGDLLAGCFSGYKDQKPGDPDGNQFYDWLDAMADLQRLMIVANAGKAGEHMRDTQGAKSPDANIKPSMVKAFMKGVAYLDRIGRKSHRVKFVGGTAKLNGVDFSTSDMRTVLSGQGFAIWVMSEKGKLYAGSHVKGMVHHSSFLEGENVMCGGELIADAGKIKYLSAKTGHYKATTSHLVWALTVFETCVNNFDGIKVLVFKDQTVAGVKKAVPKLLAPRDVINDPFGYDAWGDLGPKRIEWIRSGQWGNFSA